MYAADEFGPNGRLPKPKAKRGGAGGGSGRAGGRAKRAAAIKEDEDDEEAAIAPPKRGGAGRKGSGVKQGGEGKRLGAKASGRR